MPFAMIQFPCRVHVLRSSCDEIIIRRINPPPPANDCRICTKLRIFAVPVLWCSMFRCSSVPLFLVLLIARKKHMSSKKLSTCWEPIRNPHSTKVRDKRRYEPIT